MMIKPGIALAGAAVVVVIAMVLIPVPKIMLDFSDRHVEAAPAASATSFRETRWYELVPKDWDPNKVVHELQQGMQAMSDADPRAIDRLRKIHDVWDDAPTNKALDGVAVRLPGYIVPLEEGRNGLKEFLLVPYFGACIHTPPPPSNQIIHVRVQRAVQEHVMDAVWVSGTLTIERQDSSRGISSYALAATTVEHYVKPDGR
jgi:hypothetical protein